MVVHSCNPRAQWGRISSSRSFLGIWEFEATLGYLFQKLNPANRAGEMDQCLTAFAAFIEDLGWVPSALVVAHNCLQL